MTIFEFQRDYKTEFVVSKSTHEYIVTIIVTKNSDNSKTELKTSLDFSHFMEENISFDRFVELAKRGLLEHYAKYLPIDGFYPMDKETDIASYKTTFN